MPPRHDIYVEAGSKRTFACAVQWPGWCRYGKTEDEALTALLDYAPRYQALLARSRLGFIAPTKREQLIVVERLKGNAGTDFGAPAVPPGVDADRSCPPTELKRLEAILRAGWRAFDAAVEAAQGKRLATGPRGGGRSLEKIVAHVLEADEGYLRAVGWKPSRADDDVAERLATTRRDIVAALRASAAGEIPATGPRGGERWTARYFARRVIWHVISHAWEIERRVASGAADG